MIYIEIKKRLICWQKITFLFLKYKSQLRALNLFQKGFGGLLTQRKYYLLTFAFFNPAAKQIDLLGCEQNISSQ